MIRRTKTEQVTLIVYFSAIEYLFRKIVFKTGKGRVTVTEQH